MRALVVPLFASLVFAQSPAVVPLVDGNTLAGWRGDAAVWRVQDGCIVGSTQQAPIRDNAFLVREGEPVADFVFEVQVRIVGDNNGGVQYRSRVLPEAGGACAGYQCDVHKEPKYMAMLYDERQSGIVAERGQFVRWRDDGKHVVGALANVRPLDAAQWHTLRIVAMGPLCWHLLDGAVVTAVLDERSDAPRRGVLALELHGGAPVRIEYKAPTLQVWSDLAAMQRQVTVPAAIVGLQRLAAKGAARPAGAVPMWLWDAQPGDGEELFFRKAFALGAVPAQAQLAVACDNHCRVYINGEKVGESNEWEAPLRADVARYLRAGDNVLAVHGWNDGGVAGLAARLAWQENGKDREVVSDATWTCSDDDTDGWNTAAFAGKGFGPVTVLGALGDNKLPWTRVHGRDGLGVADNPFVPQVATVATEVTFVDAQRAPAAPVLRLLDVPRSLGSWVSLGADDQGRIYAGAQGGGLYRVTPASELGGESRLEKMPVELTGAHGLLWWRNSLYAVVNEKNGGLYRLRDSNGDDLLDQSELLQKLDGSGEHGPHSVVVAPDGEHLLVVCGNQTRLPPLAASRVATNWAEDRLLPRLEDPHKYWEGHSPPGGWVCQCDADGKNWELITCGFRNPFDVVVMPDHAVVVYDADMEWDMGLPWYRPTRLLQVLPGVDYGWRIGSAKWPADYPDAPHALADVGPGSPTGMVYDPKAGLLSLDWTFGVVYQYDKPWLVGAPLPLTDAVCVPKSDRIYVATGGRGLPSSLLCIDLKGEAAEPWPRAGRFASATSRWLTGAYASFEALAEAVGKVSLRPPGIGQPWFFEPWLSARAALEAMPVASYRDAALRVTADMPWERWSAGLLALARHGAPDDLQPVLDALGKLSFAALDHAGRIAWLRVHALALLRLGPATEAQKALVAQRLLPLFPTGNERQDQDLAELLVHVDAPGLLDKLVPALTPMKPSPVPAWAHTAERGDVYGDQYGGVIRGMVETMPPIGQLAIADALRTVTHGWTLAQRRSYFGFLAQARQRKGGSSYEGFVKRMIDAAWTTCSADEQRELAALVREAKADAPKFVSTPPKGPGRQWTAGDLDGLVRDGLAGGDLGRGRNLFHAVSCAGCHYFAGEGGNHGPDLTSLGNKFTARDVLEAIVTPSKVVSDQYTGQVLTKKDGSTLFGFATKTHDGDVEVWEVMPATADAVVVKIPVADVTKVERSPLSPMPTGLVDGCSAAELRDLLAFLLSRGAAPAGK